MSGTGQVLAGTTSGAVAVAVLPNTGSSVFVSLAVAVAAGLFTWGALHIFANK